ICLATERSALFERTAPMRYPQTEASVGDTTSQEPLWVTTRRGRAPRPRLAAGRAALVWSEVEVRSRSRRAATHVAPSADRWRQRRCADHAETPRPRGIAAPDQ